MALDYIKEQIRAVSAPTGAFVPATVLEHKHLKNQLILHVYYVQDTTTSIELKIEFSDDNVDFVQETADVFAGTSPVPELLIERQFTSAGNYRLPIPIQDKYIKVSVKATGAVGADTVRIDAVVGID